LGVSTRNTRPFSDKAQACECKNRCDNPRTIKNCEEKDKRKSWVTTSKLQQ
jgi:hypothetical protein